MIDFDNFILDKHEKDILKKLIINDHIKFLFIGEKESGKTTLINSIKNKFLNDDSFSILKINNYNDISINYFRQEVKQFCQIYTKKKKIIIIDDIDLIKDTCQHIFCSLITKYPNLHFICSCKNIRKLNDNIINKCIIFDIKKMNKIKINTFINFYIKKYNLEISDDSIKYLVDNCNNYPSIIVNNLKSLSLFKKPITLSFSKEICEIVQTETFDKYFNNIKSGKIKEANEILLYIYENCVSLIDTIEFLYRYVKNCDETIINNVLKLKIIKIISKYKLIFNILHENKIEIYFITKYIYYEFQKNI